MPPTAGGIDRGLNYWSALYTKELIELVAVEPNTFRDLITDSYHHIFDKPRW